MTADRPTDDDAGASSGADPDDESIQDVPDGAGCTEIWEHLSERRERDAE